MSRQRRSAGAAEATGAAQNASRRRRPLRFGVGAAVVGVLVAVLLIRFGSVDKAIQELTLPLRHDDMIRQQADEKDVDAALIAAVIYTESKFTDADLERRRPRPDADHPGSGEGHREPQRRDHLQALTTSPIPKSTSATGPSCLRELLERYDGDEVAALAAYNAGPGNADKWGGAGLTIDDIAFPETRAYVEEVLEKQRGVPAQVRQGAGLLRRGRTPTRASARSRSPSASSSPTPRSSSSPCPTSTGSSTPASPGSPGSSSPSTW